MGLFDFIGDVFGLAADASQAKKERSTQREFAQNQIQWRVADAKAAGVHPLYALGATVTPYQSSNFSPGSYLSEMGQDISRARMAQMDARERRAELDAATRREQAQEVRAQEAHNMEMQRGALENKYLASQIARLNSAQVPPARPSTGGVGGQRVVPQPSRPFMSAPNDARRQAGTITDYQYVHTGGGRVGVVPSEDIAQRFDEIPFAGLGWWYRNNALPFMGMNVPAPPPRSMLPRGYNYWLWDGTEFVPSRTGKVPIGNPAMRLVQ